MTSLCIKVFFGSVALYFARESSQSATSATHQFIPYFCFKFLKLIPHGVDCISSKYLGVISIYCLLKLTKSEYIHINDSENYFLIIIKVLQQDKHKHEKSSIFIFLTKKGKKIPFREHCI